MIFLFCQQGSLGAPAGADVADIALDYLFISYHIHIADEFHLDQSAAFRPELQVLIADKLILLQRQEGIPAGFDILERTYFPEFLFHKLFPRVAQHVYQVRVDIADRSGFGIQDQNAVLGRFKESPVTKLGINE